MVLTLRSWLNTVLTQQSEKGSACSRIVYISCNPVTLAANLAAVADSHRVLHFALFDQFPGTDHIECGAYLERRTEPVVH